MILGSTAKHLIVLTLLATVSPAAAVAKPNSYPGENSRFQSTDTAVIAQQKAERERRIKLRKQRREERRRERLKKRNNRSD